MKAIDTKRGPVFFRFGFLIVTVLSFAGLFQIEAQSPSDAERLRIAAQDAADRQMRAERAAAQEKAMRDAGGNTEVLQRRLMNKVWSIDQFKKANLREATEAEKLAIAVNGELLAEYQKLSLNGVSGMNRLLYQVQCGYETADASLRAHCLKYSMPGNGASFSFRANRYRATRYADLTLTQEGFVVGGVRTISFIADLGIQDLSKVTLESNGVKSLADYVEPKEYLTVKRDWEAFDAGKLIDGILFNRRIKPTVGNSYALRSIAYGGESLQKSYETVFNELDLDERTDVVVVFSVVKQDKEGYTIIWRQLSSTKAPSYKFQQR